MSTSAYLDLFGAPSTAAVAAELGRALDLTPILAGTLPKGEEWSLRGDGYTVDVHGMIGIPLLTGEGDIWVSIWSGRGDREQQTKLQHQIADRLFDHLVKHAQWGVIVDSEDEGFTSRSFMPAP